MNKSTNPLSERELSMVGKSQVVNSQADKKQHNEHIRPNGQYRILYPTVRKCTAFSHMHKTFSFKSNK